MAHALHFDPAEATRELEAQGFEHRQAAAIVTLIRDRVLAHTGAARDEDADAAVAAITQTERRLEAKIDGVETRLNTRIDRLDAKIDGAVTELRGEIKDLRHEMQLIARDTVEKAGARADAAASRSNMYLGFATGFLGLMIAASALLPAVVALFK